MEKVPFFLVIFSIIPYIRVFLGPKWATVSRQLSRGGEHREGKMADQNPYLQEHLQDYLSSEHRYSGLLNSQSNFTRHMLDMISQLPTNVELRRPGNYSQYNLAKDFNSVTMIVRDTMLDQVRAYDDLWNDVQKAKLDVKVEQDHWSNLVNQINQGVSYFDTEETSGMIAKSVLAVGVFAILLLLLCCCCCAKSLRDSCCGSLCPPVRVVHHGARRYQAPQEV